jgi:hypothetical protein
LSEPLRRTIGRATLGAVALVLAAEAAAQSRQDLERCRAIVDAARRLDCYDAIPLAPASAVSKYEVLALQELMEFALTYRGRFVEVQGWLSPGDADYALGIAPQAERTMPIDLGALDRREQQALAAGCAEGCAVTLRGRVGPLAFTTGIHAEAVLMH